MVMVIASNAVPAAITQVDARTGCKFTASASFLIYLNNLKFAAAHAAPSLLRPDGFGFALPKRPDRSYASRFTCARSPQALRRRFAEQAVAPVIDSATLHQHHQLAGIIRIRFAKLRQGGLIGSDVRDISLLQILVG
jgi:hypothetical protein